VQKSKLKEYRNLEAKWRKKRWNRFIRRSKKDSRKVERKETTY
jgi:hypothetical protein